MLHLRVIAPAELSDAVIDALKDNPGVAHLVVHRDAAQDPPGDEITADIARESANEVIDALKALGVKERGAITLDVVDTVLSTRAYRAEEKAAGDPADAVVWDELAARTREESTLNVTYMTFLCLACLIAAVGVVTDSPVTVVGAMVVGPDSARWPPWRSRWCDARHTWPAALRWRCWSASPSPCWSPRSACWPGRPSAGSK